MTEAETLFDQKLAELQNHVRNLWAGREREAVIEIVRAADEAACIFRLGPVEAQTETRQLILKGAAPALATFLPLLRSSGRGLPFGPSTPTVAAIVDGMLHEFGKLAALQRVAALERYGLAECVLVGTGTMQIQIRSDGAEEMDRQAERWLTGETKHRLSSLRNGRSNFKQIAKLLDRTSSVDRGWAIRYEGHKKLIRHYRECATTEVLGCSESEALPHDAEIGGRSFAEWRIVCIAALGSLFNHIAYSTRLQRNHPNLMLRNLLTTPVLKRDAVEVWLERGEKPDRVEATLSHLTINADTIVPWQKHHEIPAPFYVDVGGGWLLLCMFGALLNPVCSLVRSLRLQHAREWDAAVGSREGHYREDLQSRFPAPRFLVPDNGFILRRGDGSHLTDVDAVILDRRIGTLGLVQLKWPDVFGLSLKERESRRLNLLKANEWVERVAAWINGRSAAEVAKALGITGASDSPPVMLVMPRYAARFTLNDAYDDRAGWVSWPEVVRLMIEEGQLEDPLLELAERFKAGGLPPGRERLSDIQYDLKDLTVRLQIV
jgi:hypothetical protein